MIRSLPLIVLMALLAGYIATLGLGRASEFPASGVHYAFFASPKESVSLLADLAQRQDWQGLRGYIHQPNEDTAATTRAALTSGSFDFSGAPTEAKDPFPLHAEYVSSTRKTDDQIHVTIRYPLAESTKNGNADRTATGTYHLVYTPFGYQVLPN